MFIIIKKAERLFYHNNGFKNVNLSRWTMVIDHTANTLALHQNNGALFPNNEVPISEVVFFDETVGGSAETFATTVLLEARLIAVEYNGLVDVASGGGGGATTFLALTDTPNTYTGQGGKKVVVKTDETGLEFVPDVEGVTPTPYSNNFTYLGVPVSVPANVVITWAFNYNSPGKKLTYNHNTSTNEVTLINNVQNGDDVEIIGLQY
jgi:hypothetical protein